MFSGPGITVLSLPQQRALPEVVTPQVRVRLALMEAKDTPAGGVARPYSLEPQQRVSPEVVIPQAW